MTASYKQVIHLCLYVKKSAKGIVHVALYLDVNLMVGNIATINGSIEELKNKGLILKIVEELQEYISCEIKFSDYNKHAWFGQPHLIKDTERKFSGLVQEIQS